MTPFDPFDLPALRRADERTLELHRRLLVENADAGREPVIDELCLRALPVIVAQARLHADQKGLGREQLMGAVEETAATLQMRLRSAERLDLITELAKTLAGEAVDARAAEPPGPPRMVSRPPDLRAAEPASEPVDGERERSLPERDAKNDSASNGNTVNDKLGVELSRNRIKRNNPENS